MQSNDSAPVRGYRVLDLGGQFSLYCTKLLADLGADVIRVEPPGGGDAVRKAEPFAGDEPGPDRSLQHLYFNTSKRDVTLNLGSAEGRQLFLKLAAGADAVIEAFAPGYLASIGLGYEALSAAHPRIILTSITGFGQTGLHAQWQSNDLVALAMSGVLTLSGFVDRPPYRPYPSQAVYCAGIEAANATLLALLEREFSGRGQWIDVSAQESLSMAQETAMQLWDMQKRARARTGSLAERGLGAINETADGYLYGMIGVLARGASMADFVRWMDEEGMADDLVTGGALEQLETAAAEARTSGRLAATQNPELMARLVPVIRRFMKARPKEDLYAEGQRRGFFVSAVNDTRDIVESEQLRQQEWFVDLPHPELGTTVKFPGPPYRFTASPARQSHSAPRLGEHNLEVYRDELGLTQAEFAALEAGGAI